MIVMAISTSPRHVTVVAGSAVPLSKSEADSVISSFRDSYQSSHDFTSATVSALQTLQDAVSTSPRGGSRGTNPAPAPGSALNGLWCLVGLVILGALAFFVIRRRRSGGLPFNQPQYDQLQYDQPYQGNYPPNYGPNYPPQQGGINPLAAGGLGAAAGGLLGYELGKERGEREAREEQGYGGDGGQYGGGSVGDFGGGNDGGDFGGGSVGDFGGDGGGDYGGGSSGDF
jgi:ABC-type cobalt transport system substrate-binding protein